MPTSEPVESDQLADMRHVYANPASLDTTFAQKTCRKWMRSYLKDFMAVKSRMEEAANERNRSAWSSIPFSDEVESNEDSWSGSKLLDETFEMWEKSIQKEQ